MLTKICKKHGKKYNYVCSECLKPFLENLKFKSLEEIREYQKANSKKIVLKDKRKGYNMIGLIKIKFVEDFAFSGLFIYQINENKIIERKFKTSTVNINKYFPSILFLSQTDIYLEIINSIIEKPDCFVVNSSGQIHPYLYGSACDLGLKIDVPVIGYTKKLLFGFMKEKINNLEYREIIHNNQLLGYAIPKQFSKKYYYISVGNNLSLQSALKIFLKINLSILSKLNMEVNNYFQKERKKKNKNN
ncbi:MAG: endonuclease V [Promethearchaeota archaeon]